jgi:hypothetical protein
VKKCPFSIDLKEKKPNSRDSYKIFSQRANTGRRFSSRNQPDGTAGMMGFLVRLPGEIASVSRQNSRI